MKKQYLIGLLGLTAVSISMGSSLSNVTNSSIQPIGNENSGIKVIEENSHVYVATSEDSEVTSGDMIDSIQIDATYTKSDKDETLTIDKNEKLVIYSAADDPLKIQYSKINDYFKDDADGDGVEEGFEFANDDSGDATFTAEIDFIEDSKLKLPNGKEIWATSIKDDEPYVLCTTATSNNQNLLEKERIIQIGTVDIKLGFKESTVSNAEATIINKNDAIITYTAEAGNELNGNLAEFESATLYDSESNRKLGTSADEVKGKSIKVTDLIAGTTYSNAELWVKFSNGLIKEPVNNLITDDAKIIPPTITTNEVEPGKTSASVTYDIKKLGTNKKEEDNVITNIQWVEKGTTDTPFYGSKPASNLTGGEGTLTTVDELPSGETIPESEIVVTYEGMDEPLIISVDSFETIGPNLEEPTVFSEVDQSKTTINSVTFNYSATNGQDPDGDSYFLGKIEILDNKENSMGSIGSDDASKEDALKANDSITINDLNSNTKYNGWTMEATFIAPDEKTYPNEIKTTSIEQFKTLKDGLGAGAIIGIIIGVLFFVGIIVLIGWILYKKYNAKKISMETKVQVKEAIKKQEQEQK